MKSNFFQRYLLPGFVLQSVVIAGGYGTGRELVEFFLKFGPVRGLFSMTLIATVAISIVSAASFEFARIFRCYDYRSFFVHLLGRGWFLYEIGYMVALLLILAVVGSAAGTILDESFSVPYAVGVVAMMVAVGFLVFKGTATIERVMAVWSFVLYAIYIIFFVWAITRFGHAMLSQFGNDVAEPGWALSGFKYGVLQVSLIPAVLFTAKHIETRREAVVSGLLAGVIAMMPGFLFYLAMMGQYPAIVERPAPVNYMLDLLGSRSFQIAFQVVLFGTLIETGTGLIHAFNERIANTFAGLARPMPVAARPLIALGLLTAGALLSKLGLVNLVAHGYGTASWIFIFIYALPMLTWGVWKMKTSNVRE
ncbi:MAG: hypothetical protein ACE5HT_11425 [Gemmatimonadales bacterium]